MPIKNDVISNKIKLLSTEKLEGWDKSWNQNIIDELKLERDNLNLNVNPKREIEMKQSYKMAQAKIKISGNNHPLIDETIESIEAEYQIVKGIFLSANKNPDLKKNSFFYKIDFEKWKQALIISAIIHVYTYSETINLFFSKPIRLMPELLRVLTTALYYGMNSNQAFNYARYIYQKKLNKKEILQSYEKLSKYKKY